MSDNSLMTPIKNESLVQRVINRIVDAIVSGEYKPGDRLPTEIELASTFQVSRNTVREAIRTLISYGVVEIRRPEGTFVSEGGSGNMLNPMLYQIILQREDSHNYIHSLRKMVDIGMTYIIREQGLSAEDEAELERLLQQMTHALREPVTTVEEALQHDTAFHKAIAAAAHNPFIAMIHDFVVDITSESRRRTISRVFEENDREYLVKTHRMTLDSLECREGISVEETVEFSYFYWKDAIKF